MQESNQVGLTNNISNDAENLPLLSTRKLSGKHKNKYIYLRYLARIATPINDSVSGYLASTLIIGAISFSVYRDEAFFRKIIVFCSPLLFVALSGLNEIRSSYGLSEKSEFVIGSSDFEHIRLFMRRLEEMVGQVCGNEYENLKLLEITLKTQGKYQKAKVLINDFRLVSRYNFIRRQTGDFSNYLMSANIIASIFYYYTLYNKHVDPELMFGEIFLKAFIIATPIWLLKIFPDIIEENWWRYENKWQSLPVPLKKCIIGVRKSVNFLSDISFAYGTEMIAISALFYSCDSVSLYQALTTAMGTLYDIPFYYNISLKTFFILTLPFLPTILYPLSQFLPYFKPGYAGKVSKNIKRGMYSMFHGVRTTSLLLTLFQLLFCLINNDLSGTNISTTYGVFSMIFSASIGLLTTANNTLNYKPANAEKMNTIANTALRELENGIAEDLHQETTNDSKAVGTQTAQNNSWNKSKLFSFWKQPSIKTADAGTTGVSINEDAESRDEIVNIISTKLEQ